MSSDNEWRDLLQSFDQCVISVVTEENEDKDDNDAAEPDPEAVAKHEKLVGHLNHKLIEIHSRLKALDEEALDLPHTPGGGGGSNLPAAANAPNAPESPPEPEPLPVHVGLGAGTVNELVNNCEKVLGQKGKATSHMLAAQLLAELARGEMGREACLKSGVIKALERVLEEQKGLKSGSLETAVQICRILGNLCYNCNDGRVQVMGTKALNHIHSIAGNRERISYDDPGQRFPVILPGFLLNFCNENHEAVEEAGKVGFVKVIVGNVLSTQTNDAVFNHSLNFLVTLSEDESGHKFLQECKDFPKALNHILVHTTSPEVTETALELVRNIAEDPDLTYELAKSPLCTTMIKHIVGRWRCGEFEDHRSDACDLLVLILSHDKSMKHIYTADNGKYLQTFLGWLKKDDIQLKVAASLAIGNFACNEEHCAQLMENKTSAVLIGLLKSHQNSNADLKLQHAVLGSIRNLAVAPAARKQLLEQGLLDPCLRLTEKLTLFNAQPVIFKLLATLRLIVDGNHEAAQKIGRNRGTVTTLVEWGLTEAQALKAESARLMAALIKHSNSAEVMENIVAVGGLAHVTTMLMSTHVRMLNEALISLSVLSVTLDADTVHAQLHTDLVINGIKKCLESESVPAEVKKNALTLTSKLLDVKTDEFKKMLTDLEFAKALEEAGEGVTDTSDAKEILDRIRGD